MTLEELKKHDGRNGQPAYVAVSGVIYDLSTSSMWKEGLHEGIHQAGQDLTEALKTAPHVRAVVERFPTVGRLEETVEEPSGSSRVWLLIIGAAVVLVAVWLLIKA